MTRINVVPVEELENVHLMAEYHELPRIFTAVRTLQLKGVRGPDELCLPDEYVLGAGHMKFFYDKLKFLHRRLISLRQELLARGYNIDTAACAVKLNAAWDDFSATPWWGLYNPTPEALSLNRARIAERLNAKKG